MMICIPDGIPQIYLTAYHRYPIYPTVTHRLSQTYHR